MSSGFHFDQAFSRNIGWVTPAEQAHLRGLRVAIGGLGGVGGSHLVTLARLGIGQFSLTDLDVFDWPNLNRQFGAGVSTIGAPKLDTMVRIVADINPEAHIRTFPEGLNVHNLDQFLDGAALYMDSLDIFALDIRRRVFAACHERGIPAITAAPMGMGCALLVFMPGRMSFEEYFAFGAESFEDQVLKFVVGVSPTMQQRHYLVERRSVDFFAHKVPSLAVGIELAAGFACSTALKVLLGRGEVVCAPRGLHFDAYRNRLSRTWRPLGNRHPLQRLMFWWIKRLLAQSRRQAA